jgi:DNA-directed RNA polymerase specialized sigma24 family protein
MGNGSDAEDVVQQTLLKAFLHLGQFQSKARFSTWFIQISIHEVLQRHRLRWSSRLVPLDQPALPRSRLPRKPPRRSSGWNEWRPIACCEKPSRSCRRKTKRHCAARHVRESASPMPPVARDNRLSGEDAASGRTVENGSLNGSPCFQSALLCRHNPGQPGCNRRSGGGHPGIDTQK